MNQRPGILFVGLTVLWATTTEAADRIQLLPYDAEWRYNESGKDLGSEWIQASFEDSPWKAGRGVFVAPADEGLKGVAKVGTLLHKGEPLPRDQVIHYFRTHFQWTNEPYGVVLIASNLIDDAAFFFLNGQEAGRFNIIRGTGINAVCRSSPEVSKAGAVVLALSGANLVRGDNVLAVALLQGYVGSSDAVFGLSLWAEVRSSGAPLISVHPTNTFVFGGEDLVLWTDVVGQPPFFLQWRKDGEIVHQANERIFRIPRTRVEDSGTYSLLASNTHGLAVSSNAMVTVKPAGLVPFHQVWRYQLSGENPATNWMMPDYNDRSWQTGQFPRRSKMDSDAPYGTIFEQHNQLASYFRTDFDYDGPLGDTELVFTAIIDDGAIIYLNGREALRIGMPLGPVDHVTQANRTVLKRELESFPAIGSYLVPGRNVLAVEVHQDRAVGLFSSAHFALCLVPKPPPPTPLEILRQPQPQTVEEGRAAEFTVEVSGAQACYQWLFNGQPLPGANWPACRIQRATRSHSGSYSVQASNAVDRVVSHIAHLMVVPDTNGPVLVEADGRGSASEVTLTFSEPVVARTAIEPSHYQLTNASGGILGIRSAQATDETHVLVVTAARDPSANYLLLAHGVCDLFNNSIASECAAPVRTRVPLVKLEDSWQYRLADAQLEDQWFLPDHDASQWSQGRGVFVQSTGDLPRRWEEGT